MLSAKGCNFQCVQEYSPIPHTYSSKQIFCEFATIWVEITSHIYAMTWEDLLYGKKTKTVTNVFLNYPFNMNMSIVGWNMN